MLITAKRPDPRDPDSTPTINRGLDLVNREGAKYIDYRLKELGLQLTLIGLAEVQAARIANLASKMYVLEDAVFDQRNVRELEPKKLLELYQLSINAVTNSSQYIKQMIDSTDWAKLETQLIQLSNAEVNHSISGDDADNGLAELAKQLLGQLNLNTNSDTGIITDGNKDDI